jgi:transitional endoplasmic reticulum ATPase
MIDIPLPDKNERKEIFEVHLRDKPMASRTGLDRLASTTEGFSGADIASVCNKAALMAVRRAIEEAKGKSAGEAEVIVAAGDLQTALGEMSGGRILSREHSRFQDAYFEIGGE